MNVRLTCNHLQWRHCNILVIAELFWIELRYQRFKLLWQTAWLNKVNKRFFGRFVLIRIFRHASLLRLPLRESPREARRAPSRSRAAACGAGCAFVLAEIQAKNNFDNNGLEATDYFVTKSQSLPSLTTTGVANLITNFFTVDQAFLASDNLVQLPSTVNGPDANQELSYMESFCTSPLQSVSPSTPGCLVQGDLQVHGTITNYSVRALADLQAVPEPTTIALLLAGLGGFGFVRRKKNQMN